MKHRTSWVAAAVLLTVLSACSNPDLDGLSEKVASLEKDIGAIRVQLNDATAALAELQTRAEQNQAAVNDLTQQLVKVKVDRDKLKQEVAALRKKRR